MADSCSKLENDYNAIVLTINHHITNKIIELSKWLCKMMIYYQKDNVCAKLIR